MDSRIGDVHPWQFHHVGYPLIICVTRFKIVNRFLSEGMQCGTVVAIPLSGFLCALELDNGWPWAFYVPGALGVIWFVLWSLMIYESPRKHPRIPFEEVRFICGSTSETLPSKKLVTKK